MILNIRGANGSGKTTVARSFLTPESYEVELGTYMSDSKVPKLKKVVGMLTFKDDVCLIGSYKNACGGMDALPSFDTCFRAIGVAARDYGHVICEGILASTVYGSWAQFAKDYWTPVKDIGHQFGFAYLNTPVEVCLQRIQKRNGGKPIKENLVHDKVRAIAATRAKAIKDKLMVFDLPYLAAEEAAHEILSDGGARYRVS